MLSRKKHVLPSKNQLYKRNVKQIREGLQFVEEQMNI